MQKNQKIANKYIIQKQKNDNIDEDQIKQMFSQLAFSDPVKDKSQFIQTVKIVEQLAQRALFEQQQDDSEEINDSKQQLIQKIALQLGKYQLILKQLCALLMLKNLQSIYPFVMLVKTFTDNENLFKLMDKNQLIYIINETLTQVKENTEENQDLIIVTIYLAYNLFRQVQGLEIGQDEQIFKQIVQFSTVDKLMHLALDRYITLDEDTITTLVESIAALADSELFIDYCPEILKGSIAYTFIKFYDTFVIPMIEKPEERAKMLCYDDVLSWIRRVRPEVEDN